MLQDELKRSINDAYVQMGKANQVLNALASRTHPGMLSDLEHRVGASIVQAKPSIQSAKRELLKFLSSER
jgi:hypothetical protein